MEHLDAMMVTIALTSFASGILLNWLTRQAAYNKGYDDGFSRGYSVQVEHLNNGKIEIRYHEPPENQREGRE